MHKIARSIPVQIALYTGTIAATIGGAIAQVDDIQIPPDAIRADYVSCLFAADNDPAFGLNKGQEWLETLRDSDPAEESHQFFAEHCVANALFLLGRFNESGQLLERLAERRVVSKDSARADLLVQSGQAYFMAEDFVRAMELQRRAIFFRQWDSDLYVDMAYSMQAVGDNLGAIDALSTAIKLDPERPDLRVLRASANRSILDYEAAVTELNHVILRWPGYPQALLERGIIRRIQGRIFDAEADWRLVIQLAPNSPAAIIAQNNLANL